jgi:four helix bundle protein
MENPYQIDKRTKLFAIDIIKFCEKLKEVNVEYPLRDQLLRSGTSIGANVHEGKASTSSVEFKRYYEIALRSAHEAILVGTCQGNKKN